MDYRIRREKTELDSTGYMEIGPGKYSGTHWQDGFLFVWEDAFGMAEGVIVRHFPAYDHFSMNEIPREIGRKIVADWREVASQIGNTSAKQIHSALNLKDSYRTRLDSEIASHETEIANMLRELADGCDEFLEHEEWLCILGM